MRSPCHVLYAGQTLSLRSKDAPTSTSNAPAFGGDAFDHIRGVVFGGGAGHGCSLRSYESFTLDSPCKTPSPSNDTIISRLGRLTGRLHYHCHSLSWRPHHHLLGRHRLAPPGWHSSSLSVWSSSPPLLVRVSLRPARVDSRRNRARPPASSHLQIRTTKTCCSTPPRTLPQPGRY